MTEVKIVMAREKRSIFGHIDHSGLPLLFTRLFVGGAFIYLSFLKLSEEGGLTVFLRFVKFYGIFPYEPPQPMNYAAIILPWVEMVCGVALILGSYVRGAALLCMMMLAAFTPMIYLKGIELYNESGRFATFWDVKFDCGCGTGVEVTWRKLLLNTSLFFAAWIAYLCESRKFTLADLFSRMLGGRAASSPSGLLRSNESPQGI